MKKAITAILTVIIIVSCGLPFSADGVLPVATSALETTGRGCVLMEAETGTILYESNKDERLPPASVTKVMTMLLVLEAVEGGSISFTDIVAASERAVSMGGTQIYLEVGETMTVDELFKAVAVPSANDAAVALAEYISGSEAVFVEHMNERAAQLGMTNTVFTNCTGLFDDEGHFTSAYDLALATRELLTHPVIHEYTTIWMDSLRNGQFGLANTNKMLRTYSGMNGMKTGYTRLAGHCLSGTASRDGMTLIAVCLGAPTSKERFSDVAAMLDYGFAGFTVIEMDAEIISPVTVNKGKQKTVKAAPDSGFSIVTAKSANKKAEVITEISENLSAPVEAGTQIGTVVYKIDGETVAVVPVKTIESVAEASLGDYFVWIMSRMLD